jgi:hypothetical protein
MTLIRVSVIWGVTHTTLINSNSAPLDGVFMGYNNMHKDFKCLDLSKGWIYINRDVIFDESVFLFASFHSTISTRYHSDVLLTHGNNVVTNPANIPTLSTLLYLMFLCSYSRSPLCCMALTPRYHLLLECHHGRHQPHLRLPLHVRHLSSLIQRSLARLPGRLLHVIMQHLLLWWPRCRCHKIDIPSLLSQTSCPGPGQEGMSGLIQYSHPNEVSTPPRRVLRASHVPSSRGRSGSS